MPAFLFLENKNVKEINAANIGIEHYILNLGLADSSLPIENNAVGNRENLGKLRLADIAVHIKTALVAISVALALHCAALQGAADVSAQVYVVLPEQTEILPCGCPIYTLSHHLTQVAPALLFDLHLFNGIRAPFRKIF